MIRKVFLLYKLYLFSFLDVLLNFEIEEPKAKNESSRNSLNSKEKEIALKSK